MTKYFVSACLIVWLFSLATPHVYACSCIKPEVPQALREARAVFVGEVTEIIQPRKDRTDAPEADRLFRIRFKVERYWKGPVTQDVVVLSDQGRAGCFSWGPFRKGGKYLVFAERQTPSGVRIRDLAVLFSCNRTAGLAEATEDVKVLDGIRTGTNLRTRRPPPTVKS